MSNDTLSKMPFNYSVESRIISLKITSSKTRATGRLKKTAMGKCNEVIILKFIGNKYHFIKFTNGIILTWYNREKTEVVEVRDFWQSDQTFIFWSIFCFWRRDFWRMVFDKWFLTKWFLTKWFLTKWFLTKWFLTMWFLMK